MKVLLLTDEQHQHLSGLLDRASEDFRLAFADAGNGYEPDDARRFYRLTEEVGAATVEDAPLSITFAGDAWETFAQALDWPAKHGYIVQLTTPEGVRTKVKLAGIEGTRGFWFRPLDADERPLPNREFASFTGEDWNVDSVHIY